MMRRALYTCTILACLILLFQTGCVLNQQQATPSQTPSPNQAQPHHFQGLNHVQSKDARIPLINIGQASYFPLNDLIKIMGYQTASGQSKQQLLIGEVDPSYAITIGSKQAVKEGQSLRLSEAPLMKDNQLLVPLTMLSDLFEKDIHYRVEPHEIVVQAVSDNAVQLDDMDAKMSAQSTSQAFFMDAREDSAGGPVALSTVDMDELIDTAKHYMGTPYLFGAAPYPKSHKFDCSSFTQYIYGKFGITLKRVARSQADQGIPVSRKSLRKGDLVFFAVPGRFKSDKTVGHVGIYIGNGQMINTYSDKKGVHIADINKGYWSTQYLEARRVLS